MPFQRWDVVVAGAGPAGAATAALLSRAGKRVVFIDAAHFPRQKVCGEYLSAAAWKLLEAERLGIGRDDSLPLKAMTLAAPSGRNIRIAFDAATAQQPAAVSRQVLDARLVETAQKEGATFMPGFRLRGVLSSSEGVEGISVVDVADPERHLELRAPLVVAADGRRSRIVQETGRLHGQKSALVGFKRHVRVDGFQSYNGTIAMHAASGGYIGVCPVAAGIVNVCGTMPKRVLQQEHGHMDTALRKWLGDDSRLVPLMTSSDDSAEAWHTMPEVSRQLAEHRTPGVLYVGDAMGTIEPLTGQGMTMALVGARLAVDHILSAGERGVDRAVQQGYERAWSQQFAPAVSAAAWFGRILRRPRLLASLMVCGGSLPGLSGFLVRQAHQRTLTALV